MRWLVVLPLLLIGCSQPTADWYGDKDFSDDERARVESGFAWLAHQSHLAAPTIAWTLERDSQSLPHTIRRQRGPGSGERGLTGECLDDVIYLDPIGLPDEGMKPEYLPGLAAHELAHCWLSFVDDPQSDGLMHNVYPMAWTAREQAQLGRVR